MWDCRCRKLKCHPAIILTQMASPLQVRSRRLSGIQRVQSNRNRLDECGGARVTIGSMDKEISIASELLRPYNARLVRCYPINHVANDVPTLA